MDEENKKTIIHEAPESSLPEEFEELVPADNTFDIELSEEEIKKLRSKIEEVISANLNISDNLDKIKALVNDSERNRKELEETLSEIKQLKEYAKTLLPKDVTDFKNRYLLEERLKVFNTVLNLELETRKAISTFIMREAEMHLRTKNLSSSNKE